MEYLVEESIEDLIREEKRLKKELHKLRKKKKRLGVKKTSAPKKKQSIVVGTSKNPCRKCKNSLVVKKHTQITEKQLKQPYYFSQWDYCRACNSVYFEERYKVLRPDLAELEQMNNHMKSI